MTGTIRVGVGGWTYEPWRGVFYPKKIRSKTRTYLHGIQDANRRKLCNGLYTT